MVDKVDYSQLSVRELVYLAKNRDKRAFESLYKKHYNIILCFIRQKMKLYPYVEKYYEDPDDICNYTFTYAWEKLEKFKESSMTGESFFCYWLYKIAYYRISDLNKEARAIKRSKYRIVSWDQLMSKGENSEKLLNVKPEEDITNIEKSMDQEKKKNVEEAIRKLRSPYKGMFSLILQGYNFSKIAKILKKEQGTVRQRFRRGISLIKKELNK